ncbi:polysaccharide lyase family 14 protein [Schizophyllum commune]
MTDLSAFNITHFAAGSANVRVATLPPISAPALAPTPDDSDDDGFSLLSQEDDLAPSDSIDSSRTALQLLYPADSINPAARPLGGAEFYAAPLDLSNASSVTLTYSVFFPSTFDWVLGGKLPGLYGGRDGCSGGDPAEDCFSTRLMWRKGGVGELYLYAPKDKQPAALCADPHSICDAAYGLSIGRGAFRFPAGQWTTVSQTVALNTPGKADGGFALDVNGVRVVQRSDVYYRGTGIRATAVPDVAGTAVASKKAKPTTFFGGHEEEWATPVDQYVLFRDFAIVKNA